MKVPQSDFWWLLQNHCLFVCEISTVHAEVYIYLHHRCWVFIRICLFVNCQQVYVKTTEPTCTEFSGGMEDGSGGWVVAIKVKGTIQRNLNQCPQHREIIIISIFKMFILFSWFACEYSSYMCVSGMWGYVWKCICASSSRRAHEQQLLTRVVSALDLAHCWRLHIQGL